MKKAQAGRNSEPVEKKNKTEEKGGEKFWLRIVGGSDAGGENESFMGGGEETKKNKHEREGLVFAWKRPRRSPST